MKYQKYNEFLQVIRGLIKDLGNKSDLNLTKNLTPEMVNRLKKILNDKQEFINYYRQSQGLYLDKDIFKAIELKIVNDIKSIKNNPRCLNKEENLKQIQQHKKFLIKDFTNLLKDKRSWKH